MDYLVRFHYVDKRNGKKSAKVIHLYDFKRSSVPVGLTHVSIADAKTKETRFIICIRDRAGIEKKDNGSFVYGIIEDWKEYIPSKNAIIYDDSSMYRMFRMMSLLRNNSKANPKILCKKLDDYIKEKEGVTEEE